MCELRRANHNLKIVSKDASHSHQTLLYFRLGTYSQATPKLLNAYVTGCDKFASNQLHVSTSSTVLYFIYYLVASDRCVHLQCDTVQQKSFAGKNFRKLLKVGFSGSKLSRTAGNDNNMPIDNDAAVLNENFCS